MNVFDSRNKLRKSDASHAILHVYLEHDSMQCALVKYENEMAHVQATYVAEEKTMVQRGETSQLDTSLEAALAHIAEMYSEHMEGGVGVSIGEVRITMSPLFLDVETADVLRVSESPEIVKIFETDIDISDTIVHREIRNVKLNGYEVATQNALGLQAKTVQFVEEIHSLDRNTSEVIRDVFEKRLPGRPIGFGSALAETTYLVERVLSPHKEWQMLFMDHADSQVYDRESAQVRDLRYGCDELIGQLIDNDLSYDHIGVLTSMRMAKRGDLLREDLEKLTYTLDIETSVLSDAMEDMRDREKTMFIQTPHQVIDTFLARGLDAISLYHAYIDSDHTQQTISLPDHLMLSVHLYAAIEYHIVRHASLL